MKRFLTSSPPAVSTDRPEGGTYQWLKAILLALKKIFINFLVPPSGVRGLFRELRLLWQASLRQYNQKIALIFNPRRARVLSVLGFLLITLLSSLITHEVQAQCSTPSVMAKWDMNSTTVQCNGATEVLGLGNSQTTPMFRGSNKEFFCPQINAGCARALLGSKGFINSPKFSNALCLLGFYTCGAAGFTTCPPGWSPSDVNFHPEIAGNLYVSYIIPTGKVGSIASFSLNVLQKQYDGSSVNFEKQGVGVYRNGVLIYSETQPILASNVNGTPMTFTFPNTPDFKTDGSSEVIFEITFGLVHRLNEGGGQGKFLTGYDNLCINGTCGGSPMPVAAVSPATCGAGGANANGSITLSNFGATDHYDYNAGATYTGGKTYASAAAIPGGGVITNTLPNPAAPQVYTVRVFSADGCFNDLQVTLQPVNCPVNCTQPSGSVTAVQATCAGSTANNDAQLVVSGVSGGDKAAYSIGSSYTGGGYAAATALSGGTSYTFTGIANPASSTFYTVRIYSGETCYKDYPVALEPKNCATPCANPTATVAANSATCNVAVPNNDASIVISGVSNGDKVDYTAGATYTGGGYASAAALSGGAKSYTGLANPASATTYTIRVFNGSNACYTDYQVVLSPANCTCPSPTGTLSVVKATCTIITPNANGSITLSGIGNGDKIAYNIGSSYSGPAYAGASAISGATLSLTGLASPATTTTYTIRVFNNSDICYKDFQAVLEPTVCPCPIPIATVVANTATCGVGGVPNADASIAISGVSNGDKVDYSLGSSYTGGGYAAATALSGGAYTFTGIADPQTAPFTYTVRVFNTANSCYKDYQVILNPVVCPTCVPPSAPATLVVTNATCGTTGTNNNASIAVNAVVGGDRVGISTGTFYAGVPYSQAQTLVGAAYTFNNLPNPASGTQSYTVRVFNGKDDCFKDYTVSLTETPCTCKKTYFEIVCSDQTDPNSTVNNAVTSEDDFAVYELCKDNKFIDLKLTKTVAPNTGVTCPTGTDFVWTLTLTNEGTMTATNIQVADILPTGLILTASNTATGTYGASGGWMIPSLAPNTPVTLTLTTKALVSGTFNNCAEVVTALPLNDPDSTPGNGTTGTDDDYACASITVTGPKTPEIAKEFSPWGAKPNTPVRLTIKITNNEATPITLTQALVDNLPSTPAQMTVAATPNLVSGIAGVVATANGTSITIPNGAVLNPGLNTIQVDVIATAEGQYCNTIAAGALKTTACDNVVKAEACIELKNEFVVAPLISKTMLPAVIQTGQNSTLTITIENRNPETITLLQDFVDNLPTGLTLAGAASGTCAGISTFSSTDQVGLTSGSILAANSSCTIIVPVTSSTAGKYCNFIPANSLIGDVNRATPVMTGNEDHPEACVEVVATPCTTVGTVSITPSPIPPVAMGGSVSLTATATGTGASTVYNWAASGGTFSSQVVSPTYTAPATAGTYSISVTVNNSLTGYGTCTATATTTIVVSPACVTPAFSAEAIPATCNGSTANSDGILKINNVSNADKVGYNIGASYTGAAYATASTIPANGILVSNLVNPASATQYTIRVFNGGNSCFYDHTITLLPKTCPEPPSCLNKPVFTVAGVQATCSNGSALSNAKIVMSGLTLGDKVGYNAGTTFSGSYATASAIPADGVVASGLANPATVTQYVVRVFNGAADCYTDHVLTLQPKVCVVNPTCTVEPVFTATAKSSTCSGTTPNNDGSISISGISSADKVGYSLGATYTGPAYATATGIGATSMTLLSNIANPASPVTYTVRVFNGNNTCYIDQSVTINPSCANVCVTPSFSAEAIPATCNGSTANANGTLKINNVSNGDRVGYSLGATYTGAAYIATNIIPANGILVSNLANPASATQYSIRVFNGGDACYYDHTITLLPKTCPEPPSCINKPEFTVSGVQATCSNGSALSNAKIVMSGLTLGNKVGYNAGTTFSGSYASASAIPADGVVASGLANPATVTQYVVRVFNGAADCYTDHVLTLQPKVCVVNPTCTVEPVFTATAKSSTCSGTTSNNDGSISISGISSADKVGYSVGATYTGPAYATATGIGATSMTLLSNIANPASPVTYTIRVFNGNNTCYIDQSVTINPSCTNVCVLPSYSAVTVQPSCINGVVQNDGKLRISGVSNGTKVGYNIGATYTGLPFASAMNIPANGEILTGITNPASPTQYTIRVFNGANCYYDQTVTLTPRTSCPDANCVSPVFVGTAVQATCSGGTPQNNAKLVISGVSYRADKVGYSTGTSYSGPAYSSATVIPADGVVASGLANPAAVTTYTIRVFKGSNDCYTDQVLTLQPKVCNASCPTEPIFTATAQNATCTNGVGNDAKISISGVSNGTKVGIAVGMPYSGVGYAGATNIVGSSMDVLTNIANPTSPVTYTIRVFNGSDGCYIDQTATITPQNCSCGTPRCATITVLRIR